MAKPKKPQTDFFLKPMQDYLNSKPDPNDRIDLMRRALMGKALGISIASKLEKFVGEHDSINLQKSSGIALVKKQLLPQLTVSELRTFMRDYVGQGHEVPKGDACSLEFFFAQIRRQHRSHGHHHKYGEKTPAYDDLQSHVAAIKEQLNDVASDSNKTIAELLPEPKNPSPQR